MYEGFDIWAFLSGLPLGLAIAGVIWFFNWRKGKKERRFDERYVTIHQQARSFSWAVTTIAILVTWVIAMIMEGAQLAFFLLMGIWIVHMISYLIGATVASSKN